MSVILSASAPTSRFDWILTGRRTGPDPACDVDLSPTAAAATVPTLGAIIPEWLLIVPRVKCCAVAQLNYLERTHILARLAVARRLLESDGKESVYFEHGSSTFGSVGACGVDQAHVHAVGIERAFAQWVVNSDDSLVWQEVDASDPWRSITGATDYLLISNHVRAWTTRPENPVSQYLRRRLAAYLGRKAEWDYKQYPFRNNARRTIARFAAGCRS